MAPTVLLVPSGASLTAVTVMPALAVAVENALVAPLVVVSAVAPALPLVWSQARKVIPPARAPFQLASGTKRTEVLASAASRIAFTAVGAANAFHAPPLLVVYCQVPLLLFTVVTAMPAAAALSASVTWPAISADTRVPLSLAGSSLMLFRLFAPASTGASLTAVTLTVRVLGEASRSTPPLAVPPSSWTWKVKEA